VPDLVKSGHVVTPRLGFFTQDIDARLAAALKLGEQKGVLVTDVAAGGPADKAGLKRGDVITAMNSRPVPSTADFKSRLYEVKPGDSLLLVVLRKGARVGLTIATAAGQAEIQGWHGIEAEENGPEKARAMGLAIARGMVVSKVAKGSSAAKIGLNPGDVIVEVNQQRIDSRAQWAKLTAQTEDDADAIILIVRGQQSAYVVLPAEE
jgi:serine protease Do